MQFECSLKVGWPDCTSQCIQYRIRIEGRYKHDTNILLDLFEKIQQTNNVLAANNYL